MTDARPPLWRRIRNALARLFRPKPPEPGRFVSGSTFAWKGWLASAPWTRPSREYLLYIPMGYTRWKRRPMIVLLHGCRQTPEDIAAATRIAALADKNGWLVLLPRQTNKANAWGCWNWFDRGTTAGWGEAAIVAAQVRAVRRQYRAHPRRIFVAGMSAGGALAAVLGVRYRRLFAGVMTHSGLACGAASSGAAAMAVLTHGADTDYEKLASDARDGAPANALPIALFAIHGERDNIVAMINTVQLVRQYLVLNGQITAGAHSPTTLPSPASETVLPLADGRTMIVAEYRDAERLLVRLVRIPDLGHAWSGGDPQFPYNDPRPPDATALLGEFVNAQIA